MRFTLRVVSRAVALLLSVTAVSVLVVPSSPVHADVVFNNFGAGDTFGNSGRILQGESVGTIGNVDQAASFTVGAGTFDLTLITVGIHVDEPPNIGTGLLDVELWSNVAGLPGAVLESVTMNVNTTGKQTRTAAFGGTTQLNAGTTYWVVADARTTFDGAWYFNSIGDVGNTAGRSDNNPWNLRVGDDRYAFRVEGRVVPEPSSCALLALGAALLRRRRR